MFSEAAGVGGPQRASALPTYQSRVCLLCRHSSQPGPGPPDPDRTASVLPPGDSRAATDDLAPILLLNCISSHPLPPRNPAVLRGNLILLSGHYSGVQSQSCAVGSPELHPHPPLGGEAQSKVDGWED